MGNYRLSEKLMPYHIIKYPIYQTPYPIFSTTFEKRSSLRRSLVTPKNVSYIPANDEPSKSSYGEEE